jgi:hypothetical protein
MQRIAAPIKAQGAVALRAPRVSRPTLCRAHARISAAASAAGAPPPPPAVVKLAAAAASMLQGAVSRVKAAATEAARQTDEAALREGVRDSLRQVRTLALVAPFAAVTGSADTFMIITKAVASFIKVGFNSTWSRGHSFFFSID